MVIILKSSCWDLHSSGHITSSFLFAAKGNVLIIFVSFLFLCYTRGLTGLKILLEKKKKKNEEEHATVWFQSFVSLPPKFLISAGFMPGSSQHVLMLKSSHRKVPESDFFQPTCTSLQSPAKEKPTTPLLN